MSNLKFHSMLSDFPKANLAVGEYTKDGVKREAVIDKKSNRVFFIPKALDINFIKDNYDNLIVSHDSETDNYVIHRRGMQQTRDLF